MHPCHQSSHTICECCQDLMLWNQKDPRILEMQPYRPFVLAGIQGLEWCAIRQAVNDLKKSAEPLQAPKFYAVSNNQENANVQCT